MGMKPRCVTIHPDVPLSQGLSASRPQNPYTMLGTVARRSMRAVNHFRNRAGANSLIMRAVEMEIGNAKTRATKAISTEPPMRASTPGLAGADQVVPRKNLHLKCDSAHQP